MSKFQLNQVYQDTKKMCSKFRVKRSILYNSSNINIDLTKYNNKYEPVIEICNEDTFDMAIRCVNNKLNPLVLNMASEYTPGGGVEHGSMAQEECLFTRSSAFLSHPKQWYPLSVTQSIYSPQITIIKDSNYKLLKYYTDISMIAIAAVRKPKLIDNKFSQMDYSIMYNKIKSIFEIAIINDHDSLVLGALGCGAFDNPPIEVAKIFKIMIDQYKHYFKYIGFAVLVVKDKDSDNLISFGDIIINNK